MRKLILLTAVFISLAVLVNIPAPQAEEQNTAVKAPKKGKGGGKAKSVSGKCAKLISKGPDVQTEVESYNSQWGNKDAYLVITKDEFKYTENAAISWVENTYTPLKYEKIERICKMSNIKGAGGYESSQEGFFVINVNFHEGSKCWRYEMKFVLPITNLELGERILSLLNNGKTFEGTKCTVYTRDDKPLGEKE